MFECPDCNGKVSRYSAEIRVCQNCKKIINSDDLIKLLRNLGVKEKTINEVGTNLVTTLVDCKRLGNAIEMTSSFWSTTEIKNSAQTTSKIRRRSQHLMEDTLFLSNKFAVLDLKSPESSSPPLNKMA